MEYGTNKHTMKEPYFKKLRLLIISSETLFKYSSQTMVDFINSLQQGGHEVDFLTKYYDIRFTSNMFSVLEEEYPEFPKEIRLIDRFRERFPFFKKIHKPSFLRKRDFKQVEGYYFFNKSERHPPVPSQLVVDKICKPYDVILIGFLQGLLSVKTIMDIYKKTKAPIFFLSVDMEHMTGGCHYFWDCRRFISGCGKCPAIESNNEYDFSTTNLMYKKNVFDNIKCVFFGNTWMNNFAKESLLWKDKPVEMLYSIVNENQFKPIPRTDVLMDYFGIDHQYSHILFTGSYLITDKRKGFDYLVEVFKHLKKYFHKNELSKITLVFAGNTNINLQEYFPVKVYKLNYLSFDDLSKMYALATLYLSPSIQDAGPMMINQSLMCGTPVVAFEMGTAIDVIKGRNTGYVAKYKDLLDFANGIIEMLKKTDDEKVLISQECRKVALETSSYDAVRSRMEECFFHYQNIW